MHVLSSHIIAEYKSTAIGCQSCPWSAEQGNFSLPPFAPENLVFTRQVWLYRLVLACSFSIQTLNLVLTHGIPPEFRGGVHIFLPAPHTIGSVPSLSGHAVAYRLRSLQRVVLKVVRVTGAAFASPRTKCYCAPLFSHTHYWYTVCTFKVLYLFCGTIFSNPRLSL